MQSHAFCYVHNNDICSKLGIGELQSVQSKLQAYTICSVCSNFSRGRVTRLSGQLLGVAAFAPQQRANLHCHLPPHHVQCIAAGSHIANHELESFELRPYATDLSKCIAKVRCALREQCFVSRGTYSQNVSRQYVHH